MWGTLMRLGSRFLTASFAVGKVAGRLLLRGAKALSKNAGTALNMGASVVAVGTTALAVAARGGAALIGLVTQFAPAAMAAFGWVGSLLVYGVVLPLLKKRKTPLKRRRHLALLAGAVLLFTSLFLGFLLRHPPQSVDRKKSEAVYARFSARLGRGPKDKTPSPQKPSKAKATSTKTSPKK